MATDLMVWNITRDKITERMAVATEDAWAVPGMQRPSPNEKDDNPNAHYTQFILDGKWDVSDAEGPMIREYMKKFNLQPPKKGSGTDAKRSKVR
jgi:hypothetical protein